MFFYFALGFKIGVLCLASVILSNPSVYRILSVRVVESQPNKKGELVVMKVLCSYVSYVVM